MEIKHYYTNEGQPFKCTQCGSIDIKIKVEGSLGLEPLEKSYRCRKCSRALAYWAYGLFDPTYKTYFEENNNGNCSAR